MDLIEKICYQSNEQHVDKRLLSRSNLNLPHFFPYRAQFSVERDMFQTKAVEKIINTHFMFSNSFSKIV